MDKISILQKYIPAPAAPLIVKWIDYYKAELKISRNRSTKLGDYRHPYGGKGHRISVNYNLNQYSFLITLVHEFAHLLNYNRHKNKVKPHGTEWKKAFQEMMHPFFEMNIFPVDVESALKAYMQNPAASSCSDMNLLRVLKNYDKKQEVLLAVEKLPFNAVFSLPNGRKFQKLELIRKRYRCVELSTKRMYLFNPLAEVVELNNH
ncbi:SprT-like domain-containing protein [Solitalea lacus]|uniref:SprT-like domain-containing protein n=1 Tax=Solitalea lacus TaxID=2911172 RepID=UPI001EDB714E|nr:SprT-like domain-containing protein [Solitalea lacus]UKJ08295.1 SprT-like domain-containing protein [Solitalea lacus]